MKFEKTDVWGFDHALRGMRNPLESWEKSDSEIRFCDYCNRINNCHNCKSLSYYSGQYIYIGENDLTLAKKLIKAGPEHRKFLRQIFVSVDITAPLYWWKEFDTYKIGTTTNSTSTMHKISSKPITLDCFEIDDYDNTIDTDGGYNHDGNPYQNNIKMYVENMLCCLESLRINYIQTKDKRYWKELIRWLPESWLQTRTCTLTYENIYNIYTQRNNHKLTEWSISFCNWCELLPYVKELFLEGDLNS